jgi:anti-sigma-K factor RskA
LNDLLEHGQCAEVLGAYALGALPDAESTRVRRHLPECHQCRADLDGLRGVVDALPASVTQIEPPPELKARLMEIVEAEAELLRAAGAPADRPPTHDLQQRRRWFSTAVSRPVLALAAVCFALAIAAALIGTGGGGGTRTIAAQIASPLTSRVRAALELRGTRAQLEVSGLPAPAAGHVDELWVKHGSAAPEPAGTFVVQSGTVEVTRPVRAGDLVMVTVEPGYGRLAPTTAPVIIVRA